MVARSKHVKSKFQKSRKKNITFNPEMKREDKVELLKEVLVKLNEEVLPGVINTSSPEITPTEDSKKNTDNLCDAIIPGGIAFITGFFNGAAATYGVIQTGAAMASRDAPETFSSPMVASLTVFGTLTACGNVALAKKVWAEETADKRNYENYLTTKHQLEEEYDSISELLDMDNKPMSPKTPLISPTRALMPGEMPLVDSPSSLVSTTVSPAVMSPVSTDGDDHKADEHYSFPQDSVVLNIVPMSSPAAAPTFYQPSPAKNGRRAPLPPITYPKNSSKSFIKR